MKVFIMILTSTYLYKMSLYSGMYALPFFFFFRRTSIVCSLLLVVVDENERKMRRYSPTSPSVNLFGVWGGVRHHYYW